MTDAPFSNAIFGKHPSLEVARSWRWPQWCAFVAGLAINGAAVGLVAGCATVGVVSLIVPVDGPTT